MDSLFTDAESCGCRRWQCRKCNPRASTAPSKAVDFAADWRIKADEWFDRLYPGDTFTSEDVTAAVGFPAGQNGMNRNNAVGGWIQRLAHKDKIHRVSDTSSSNPQGHGATIGLWRKS